MSENSVVWSDVSDCFGPATSVPSLLDHLNSSSSAERDAAIVDLWGRLCHQGTVYEASAYAVPLLFEAAQNEIVSDADRNQLLALIVHIGLGDDTTWRGYTSWGVVESCSNAVKHLLPELTALARSGDTEASRWAIALGAYHPEAWAVLGVEASELMRSADPSVAELVHHALSGTEPDQDLIEEVVRSDEDLLDYYEQVVSDHPVETRLRRIVLELAVSERL